MIAILISILSIVVSLVLLSRDLDKNRDQPFLVRIFKILFCIVVSFQIPTVIFTVYIPRIEHFGALYGLGVYFSTIIVVLGLQFLIYGKFKDWHW